MKLIYLRKSQADNPNESVESVLERHEYQLQSFAEKKFGSRIPEEQIYREVISGETIEARQEIKKVLKRIESPDVTAVIVIEPQRLGRGDLEDCGRLVNAFRYTDTQIITPAKTYNLQEKYDRKFFEMELQRGSDYLEYYKEIQARGRRLSVQRGCYIGSIAPYGYQKICVQDENRKKQFTLEENHEEAPAVRMAFDLFANRGYGFAKVARALDEAGYRPRKSTRWSPAAIKDMLENPVYIGKVRWDRRKTIKKIINGELRTSRPKNRPEDFQIYDGLHKPLIAEDLFLTALARRGKSIRIKERASVQNPFAGLLYCRCGRAMVYRPYSHKAHPVPRLLCPNQSCCKNSSCTYAEIETQVIRILKKSIQDFRIKQNPLDHARKETASRTFAHLVARLAILKNKEQNLWEKYSEENMPKEIFETLIEKVNCEKETVKTALRNAKYQPLIEKSFADEKTASLHAAIDALQTDAILPEAKNRLLKECIERIIYAREPAERLRTAKTSEKHSTVRGWTRPTIRLEIFLRL